MPKMENGRDDPMDLGPFFLEYVLRNPFENLPNGTPPGITNKAPGKCKLEVANTIPVTQQTTMESAPTISLEGVSNFPGIQQNTTIKPEVANESDEAIDFSSSSNENGLSAGGKFGTVTVKQEPPENVQELETKDEDEQSSTTEDCDMLETEIPKVHIGSNVKFAYSLRHLSLPARHLKVKKWLLQNYKYTTSTSGWLWANELLAHVKMSFPEMKSSVLTRIMKCTFPSCKKVINKSGYFYMGLCPKSTESTSIESGTGCKSASPSNPRCLYPRLKSALNSKQGVVKENGYKEHKLASLANEREQLETNPTNSAEVQIKNRRKCHKPPKLYVSSKIYEDPVHSVDTQILQGVNRGDEGEPQEGTSDHNYKTIAIKAEADDEDYNKNSHSFISNHSASLTTERAKTVLNASRETIVKGSTVGIVSSGQTVSTHGNQTLNSVVDLLNMKQRYHQVNTQLSSEVSRREQAEKDLLDAHKEITHLKEQLSTRNTQISDLATNFFNLSSQFVQTSNEFKKIMQDLQSSDSTK